MDRRLLIGTGIGALAGSPMLAAAQEASPETEDRFAALEARIAELEDRVTALEGANESTVEGQEPADTESTNGGIVTVTGVGTSVSDPVQLTEGRYRLNAEVTPSGQFAGFILYAYGPNGSEELLFNEFLEGGGVHEMSTLFTVPETEDYIFAAENVDGSWTIVFEPF